MAKKKRAESRTRYFIRNQAVKRGWNTNHPSKLGDCLEEQEISNFISDLGLGLDKPDFLFLLNNNPCMIIEAKNDLSKIDIAIKEAIEYAEKVNSHGKHTMKIAVGVAGEEDFGFAVVVRYLKDTIWKPLISFGYEITTIPSKQEIELALEADDATTSVTIPSSAEFVDAAIELSGLLRTAKIEAPLRPKVIGAIVLALYQGEIETSKQAGLQSVNQLGKTCIDEAIGLADNKKERLQNALILTSNDFERLEPFIGRIVSVLKRLNVRSILHTSIDFLGLFYEAFLRYGYDNNALGIVFTPRHITKFCVELTGAGISDRVIDVASGTGGFLVAAFDKMMSNAVGPKAIAKVKQSLCGLDTNPTVWALATLNMFFRGDGKSHIENQSAFDENVAANLHGKFTRAYLNPPFSQEGEPERDFINIALDCLEPEGLIAVVVKAGIFADDDNKNWRREFIRKHTLLALISLPEDLFYPTAAPTSIMIAKAHIPQSADDAIFMSRIWNDGFEKLKGRRVEIIGSQLPEIQFAFDNFRKNIFTKSPIVSFIKGKDVLDGEEFSPQQWLEQPIITQKDVEVHQKKIVYSIYQTVSMMPDLADNVIEKFADSWSDSTKLEYNKVESVGYFFDIVTPKSMGEKNYIDGTCPFVSSGDKDNSIVRLIHQEATEVIETGGITVTAFGQAYLQPWAFMGRGNGGSAVRVLIPKFKMTLNEMIWFAAQINMQKWRFFYGRMSIKSRIAKLQIASPPKQLKDTGDDLSLRVMKFKASLDTFSEMN
jgi:type I restriction enzyme M protein